MRTVGGQHLERLIVKRPMALFQKVLLPRKRSGLPSAF
jgi:hypothetical protein